VATGVKLANHELTVIATGAMATASVSAATIHAHMRRNVDSDIIL